MFAITAVIQSKKQISDGEKVQDDQPQLVYSIAWHMQKREDKDKVDVYNDKKKHINTLRLSEADRKNILSALDSEISENCYFGISTSEITAKLGKLEKINDKLQMLFINFAKYENCDKGNIELALLIHTDDEKFSIDERQSFVSRIFADIDYYIRLANNGFDFRIVKKIDHQQQHLLEEKVV